jgi:hypothetical protein
MFHLDIFIFGLLVMSLTVTAAVLVGLQEARDPSHSRPEDLATWERNLVDRPDLEKEPANLR